MLHVVLLPQFSVCVWYVCLIRPRATTRRTSLIFFFFSFLFLLSEPAYTSFHGNRGITVDYVWVSERVCVCVCVCVCVECVCVRVCVKIVFCWGENREECAHFFFTHTYKTILANILCTKSRSCLNVEYKCLLRYGCTRMR